VTTVAAFRIPGKPQAWQRAGISRRRGRPVVHFTPAETRAFKRVVALLAKAAMAGRKPVHGPLVLDATFCMPIPRSWPKRDQLAAEQGLVFPTSRPDIDNLIKGVKDALTGIVWVDDCQVVRTHLQKVYSRAPSTDVVVRELIVKQGETP
jgi:Holliday junction resolvase RusA-like endonuclease